MNIAEAIRIALRSLWANKLRSVLTLLGVVIGIAAVIAVVTFVSGIQDYVATKIFNLGADVFIVAKMSPIETNVEHFLLAEKRKNFTLEDYQAVLEACRHCDYIGAMARGSGRVKHNEQSISDTTIQGITPSVASILDTDLTNGRMLNDGDLNNRLQVAVVGTDIVEHLLGDDRTEQIVILLSRTEDVPLVQSELQQVFQRDRLDLELRSWDQLAVFHNQVVGLFGRELGIIRLIVGTIVILGISNVIGMALLERRFELATFRALGVRARKIGVLLMTESLLIGLLGAGGGVLLGVLVTLLLAPSLTANAATSNGFKPKPNPEWCQPGYRCLQIDDYAHMTTIKINLEEEVAKLKAGNRHFGFGCAIGPGLGLVVDENLKAHLVPNVGATCGLAVKF